MAASQGLATTKTLTNESIGTALRRRPSPGAVSITETNGHNRAFALIDVRPRANVRHICLGPGGMHGDIPGDVFARISLPAVDTLPRFEVEGHDGTTQILGDEQPLAIGSNRDPRGEGPAVNVRTTCFATGSISTI